MIQAFVIPQEVLFLSINDSLMWLMQQKVENRVSILSDLRELASAESLDTFTLIYTNILEHQPDCPVSTIEKCFVMVTHSSGVILWFKCFFTCRFLSFLAWIAAWGCWKTCGSAGRHTTEGCKGGMYIYNVPFIGFIRVSVLLKPREK